MPLISALVFMVNSGVCFACSTPVSWTACDCEAPSFTLTINTNGHGTVAKSPDQPTYSRGEVVTVAFSPNADRVFLRWLCTPNSHTASGSESDAVRVFMTADTTLTPVTMPKNYTLYVNWNKNRGTVALPPGGTMGDGSLTAPITYGSTVNLTATPNSGYYTVWVGQYPDDWSGIRYGNSVSFKVTGNKRLTASFKPNSEYPSTMYNLTVEKNGGSAQIFSAGATSESFTSGGYPYTTATGPANFTYVVNPLSGYALRYLSWTEGGQTLYSTGSGMTYVPGNTYTAYLAKKVTLEIETEGQGVVTSPDFTSSWNPQPYNVSGSPGTTLTPIVNANEVVMTPSACPGWAFDHWEYQNGEGQWVETSGNPLQDHALTVYMNWWTGTGIHVPNGEDTFSVKAAFIERGVDISLYSTQEGCFLGYAQRVTGGNSYAFDTGREAIETLENATTAHCMIGNLYIFSHAWIYNSPSGIAHGGGFYSSGGNNSGFYGVQVIGDDADARYLSDLQAAVSGGSIKFADNPNLRVFLEGCRIGETGSSISIPSSFVMQLGGITDRKVVSACGGTSESEITASSVTFSSGPGSSTEANDGRYDGWLEEAQERGTYVKVPPFTFSE